MNLLTLVNYEAVLREVLASNAVRISSEQEQEFGWVLSDGFHSGLVPKIKSSHLTGYPENAELQHIQYKVKSLL